MASCITLHIYIYMTSNVYYDVKCIAMSCFHMKKCSLQFLLFIRFLTICHEYTCARMVHVDMMIAKMVPWIKQFMRVKLGMKIRKAARTYDVPYVHSIINSKGVIKEVTDESGSCSTILRKSAI